MRLVLMSYFDIGASYGIGDDAFPRKHLNAPPEILQVGIRNPLGVGIGSDLMTAHPALMRGWQNAAVSMLERKEMELGWTTALGVSDVEFKGRLATVIREHSITRCDLSICAVGTTLLWLEFDAGLHQEYLQGVSTCFEFAAYTPSISGALRSAAVDRVHAAIGSGSNPLAELSRRPEPPVETDAAGYRESRLLTSFSRLHLCIDAEDERVLADASKAIPFADGTTELIQFEYHGTLHFGWAGCMLVPRSFHNPDEEPRQQIARMVECIRIAHIFLGACEALERLTVSEIFRQVGHYVEAAGEVRNARDLNRLRTLALAVVSLTNVTAVASSEEDQKYFETFERYARIEQRNRAIQNRCDILYSVQLAEAQAEKDEHDEQQAEQDRRLSYLVSAIAGLTLISVLVDSYSFYKGSEPDLLSIFWRGITLGALIGAIMAAVVVTPRLVRMMQGRRRSARRRGRNLH